MQTQTISTKTGRQYIIEQDDTLYSQRMGNENLHYQVTNLKFGAHICLMQGTPRTIIDCGMNVGMNTVEYATFAKKVIGFEPTPEIYDLARKNIEWNQKNYDDSLPYMFDWSRQITADIITHNVGLSDTRKSVQFISHPKNRGHNHMWNGTRQTEKTMFDAEMFILDSYQYDEVDYMKMDTEGHELPILKGAVTTINNNRPVVQVEIVPDQCRRYGYTADEIWHYFVTKDYKVFTRDGIERTEDIIVKHKQGGRYRIYHRGTEITGQMDYWFIPREHNFCQQPKYTLFE